MKYPILNITSFLTFLYLQGLTGLLGESGRIGDPGGAVFCLHHVYHFIQKLEDSIVAIKTVFDSLCILR